MKKQSIERKNMTFKKILLATIAVSGFASLSSYGESLTDAVDYAIRTNPAIHESRANIAAVYQELRQAHSRSKPQVGVNAQAGYEVTDADSARYSNGVSTGYNGNTYENGSSQMWRSGGSVKLTQNLFDGGSRDSQQKMQAARVDASTIRLQERSEFIGIQVVYTYLELLRQQETLNLAAKNVETHRAIVNQVRSLGSRTASAADVAQANSRLARAEDTYTIITQELEAQAIAFENLVGRKPGNLTKPTINRSALPVNMEETVNLTLKNNATIRYAKADVDASKADQKTVESSYYPNLDLELQAGASTNTSGSPGTTRSASAMLQMNWDVYTGGARDARFEEYKQRMIEKTEVLRGAERNAVEEAKRTWDTLLRTDVRIEALLKEVQYAREVVITYREEFDAGSRDLLDVLQAENDLFAAHSNLIEAKYSLIYNRYRLLAVTGNLLNHLGIKPIDAENYSERARHGVAYTEDNKRLSRPEWTRKDHWKKY